MPGIPVVLVVAPMVGNDNNAQDLYLTHVGYDDTKFGELIGDAMVKALKDSGRTKAKIAVLAARWPRARRRCERRHSAMPLPRIRAWRSWSPKT